MTDMADVAKHRLGLPTFVDLQTTWPSRLTPYSDASATFFPLICIIASLSDETPLKAIEIYEVIWWFELINIRGLTIDSYSIAGREIWPILSVQVVKHSLVL